MGGKTPDTQRKAKPFLSGLTQSLGRSFFLHNSYHGKIGSASLKSNQNLHRQSDRHPGSGIAPKKPPPWPQQNEMKKIGKTKRIGNDDEIFRRLTGSASQSLRLTKDGTGKSNRFPVPIFLVLPPSHEESDAKLVVGLVLFYSV